MKKTLAIILSLALCLSLLAGCGNSAAPATTEAPTEAATEAPTEAAAEAPTEAAPEDTDPIEALPGSIFCYGYPVEGMGNLVQFYHFYPDDLGIGAVFYAGYAWNQITFYGTYTVEEAPCDYEVLLERGDETPAAGTAPYTIHLLTMDGEEVDKLAYDGEYVYNISTATNCDAATSGGNYRQVRADEATLEAYADTFEGEKGIAYMNFVCPDDASATVQLNTNGTYDDLAVFAVTGTWARTADGEYTLTPGDAADDGAVMTQQADGSWLYVSASGDEVVMNEVKGAAVAYTFAGKTPFMDGEADVTIHAYDDGTCDVVMAAFSMELVIDQGTYTFEEPAIFTFTFDGAGEIVSEFGGETGVQVTYACESVEAIGGAGVEAVCGVVIG